MKGIKNKKKRFRSSTISPFVVDLKWISYISDKPPISIVLYCILSCYYFSSWNLIAGVEANAETWKLSWFLVSGHGLSTIFFPMILAFLGEASTSSLQILFLFVWLIFLWKLDRDVILSYINMNFIFLTWFMCFLLKFFATSNTLLHFRSLEVVISIH